MPTLKTTWPTGAEITTYLTGLGITIPSGSSAADYADLAKDKALRVLGYNPLAATSAIETFDPPQSVFLDLGRDWATVTALAVNISADNPSGTALTAGTDYFLYPSEGPYTGIRLQEGLTGGALSVKVTGTYYGDGLPMAIYLAVRDIAAAACSLDALRKGALAGTLVGALSEVQQGQVKYKYATSGGGTDLVGMFTAMDADAVQALRDYRPPFVVG